jgi:ankyrin repeat protein
MHGAAWQGHTAVSEVLLNAGAHVDCKLVDGKSEDWLILCCFFFCRQLPIRDSAPRDLRLTSIVLWMGLQERVRQWA